MKGTDMTWEEIRTQERGTILRDVFDGGVRFIIMRGPCSLCAYVGIPSDHPLAGRDYDDISIEAHGGLTFSGEGGGVCPKGFYWYGWNYSHSGDRAFFDDDYLVLASNDNRKWLIDDVFKDSQDAICDFRKLVRLAEKIKGRK